MTITPLQPLQPRVLKEDDEEDAAALSCLDVLQCASALLARHKGKVAELLSRRGSSRERLERLVADVTEVLRMGAADEEAEEGGAASAASAAVREGGVKRAKGQQHQQQQQQQVQEEGGVGCDALGVAEVVEHIMSFMEGRELAGRLSRVCRLWRSVCGREALCLAALEREMPSALLGGKASLHARLGGSARRCLAMSESLRIFPSVLRGPGMAIDSLHGLFEVYHDGTLLFAAHGPAVDISDENRATFGLEMDFAHADVRCVEFSAASLGEADVVAVLTSGRLNVRFYVMEATTGVTMRFFDESFNCLTHETFDDEYIYAKSEREFTSLVLGEWDKVPSYETQVGFDFWPVQPWDKDTMHRDPGQLWRIAGTAVLYLDDGRPAEGGSSPEEGRLYFLAGLAEQLMHAKQQGTPW